jgi:LacI family transcriptional regulator
MRGPSLIPDSEYRWLGIEKAAAELGIRILPELTITLDEAAISPEIGFERTKDLLTRKQEFTAIFCFNDITAIGAIRALEASGKSVPADVSVIGFDDIISASYMRPSLTTVRQPLLEMGKRGAEVLLERISNPTQEFPAEILLQPELIVRESTGPAATA